MGKQKFEKGDTVICVISGNSSLKLFNEYIVDDTSYDEISVINEYGDMYYYSNIRFIHKSDFREIKINKILKN